jgi:uncharacterized protein YjiS (DUF1127 family)
MSLVNLFVAARNAFANWRRRQRAYDELMALDDRSLADIGLHRSAIPAVIAGLHEFVQLDPAPSAIHDAAFGPRQAGLAAGHCWLPPKPL